MLGLGSGYKLYSRISDHETVLELWGGSTKHPDSIFYFSDFKLCDWFDPEVQIVPWILECASKLNFPVHAYFLARWACDWYEISRGWNKEDSHQTVLISAGRPSNCTKTYP